MIKSMTGYGKAAMQFEDMDVTAEIKSVNHRYIEFSVRVPRVFSFLEEPIKTLIQSQVSRGRVEVYIGIELSKADNINISLNKPVLSGYLSALRQMRDEFGLHDDISVMSVAGLSDVFEIKRQEQDEERLLENVSATLSAAMEGFMSMRRAEGDKLRDDLLARCKRILELTGEVELRAPQIEQEYKDRLLARIKDNLSKVGAAADEGRILTEVAIFSERIAVAEEVVRLKSHMQQFDDMIKSGVPIGRKLDFLLQEINREANTIVSKNNDADMVKIIVEMKSEIEKLREQVQNIE